MPKTRSGQEPREQRPKQSGGYGEPRTMQEALRTVNPHYSEDYAYQVNCQRCVLAYEEQRKGLNVEAQPNNDSTLVRQGKLPHEHGAFFIDANGLPSSNQYGHSSHVNAYEGQSWDRIPRSNSTARKVRDLTNALERYGDGARFMISVDWKNGGGHVFNAEVINGTAVFIDAQSGTVRDIASTLDRVKNGQKTAIKYSRIDNKRLKNGVADWAFIGR